MAQVDPRVRRHYGPRGPLMAQPFQNPLRTVALPPQMGQPMLGPTSLFVAQAAEAQRRAAAANKPVIDVPGLVRAFTNSNAGQGISNAIGHVAGRIGAAADIRTMPARAAAIGQGMWDSAGLGWVPGDVAKGVAFGARPANATPVTKPTSQPMTAPAQPSNNGLGSGGADRIMNYQARAAGFQAVPSDIQTLGQASAFAKAVNRAGVPSSAMGTYQIVGDTMRRVAPQVFGASWQNQPFNQSTQDAIARRIFEDNKGSATALTKQWVSLSREEAERLRTMPWEQARNVIAAKESGSGQLGAFQQAAGRAGIGGPPPVDMSGYAAADRMYQQAGQNAMRPFSAEYTPTPLPEMPKPQDMIAPDTSKGDAAFAQTAPKNPFGATPEEQEKGQLKLRRASWFAGIGQALASFRDGEGLGSLFARMGGGALQGAALGDAKVQAKIDDFDDKMAQFNRALANREDGKAATLANVMNQNIEQTNRYTQQKWVQEVANIQASQPRIENGVLITKDKQPDGSVKETHTPLDPTRTTASLFARAQNAVGAVNEQNQAAQLGWQHDQSVARAALPYAMADAAGTGDFQQRNNILQLGYYDAGNALVETGRWREIAAKLNPQLVSSITTDSAAAAGVQLNPKTGQPVMPPTAEQLDQMRAFTVSALVPALINSGKGHWLVGGDVENIDPKTGQRVNRRRVGPQPEVSGAVQAFQARDRSRTVTTSASGKTSVSERYDGR